MENEFYTDWFRKRMHVPVSHIVNELCRSVSLSKPSMHFTLLAWIMNENF